MRLSRIAIGVAIILPLANALAWAAASTDSPNNDASKPVVNAPADGDRVGAEEVANVNLRYADGSRHVFQHSGATFIKVHFETLRLAPGDFVTVTNPAGNEKFTYHADPTRESPDAHAKSGDSGFTVHRTKGFGAMSVDGDTAVVTLHTKAVRPPAGDAVRVDRFFRGLSAQEAAKANPRPETVCKADARRDAVCFRTSNPKEFKTSAAVGRLIIDGGQALCTAFRVGTSNRLLTNNHCVSTPEQVKSSEVQFGFECKTCGGDDPKRGVKVTGAELIKTDKKLDFTLFSVDDPKAIAQFGTLFLDPKGPTTGEQIFIPGHGDGKPLEIAIFESKQGGQPCTIQDAKATATDAAYSCDTSPGNSGSPVIDSKTDKVVAIHHIGEVCENHGVSMSLIAKEIAKDIEDTPSAAQAKADPKADPNADANPKPKASAKASAKASSDADPLNTFDNAPFDADPFAPNPFDTGK